jgi:hypothetical protein
MARKKSDSKQKDLFNIQEQLNTAACVPAIREVIEALIFIFEVKIIRSRKNLLLNN